MIYLSPAAVAEMRGCSLSTVQRAIERGDLRVSVRIVGLARKVSVGISEKAAKAWEIKASGRPKK